MHVQVYPIYQGDVFNMEYYMIIKGDIGWIGYSKSTVQNDVVQFFSPLGEGNMTGTGIYPIEELIKITEEDYISISTPQMAWILDDEETQQLEYEQQLQKVMNKYNIII